MCSPFVKLLFPPMDWLLLWMGRLYPFRPNKLSLRLVMLHPLSQRPHSRRFLSFSFLSFPWSGLDACRCVCVCVCFGEPLLLQGGGWRESEVMTKDDESDRARGTIHALCARSFTAL